MMELSQNTTDAMAQHGMLYTKDKKRKSIWKILLIIIALSIFLFLISNAFALSIENQTRTYSSLTNSTIRFEQNTTLAQLEVTNNRTNIHNLTTNGSIFSNINASYPAYISFYGLNSSSTYYSNNTKCGFTSKTDNSGNMNCTIGVGQYVIFYNSTTPPNATIISPNGIVTNQNINIQLHTESSASYCMINISRGSVIDFSNVLVPSCDSVSLTLPQDGTYAINLLVNDSVGDAQYISQNFTLQMLVIPSTQSGGGSSSSSSTSSTLQTFMVNRQNGWEFMTDKNLKYYQIDGLSNKKVEKELLITHLDNETKQITLSCDGFMCENVNFKQKS
ncbi:MAG TPA: hypothetical protein VHA12_00180 [Candidatus Nanoarchaeia archaeon]|nr:hypothetical protein [Candidatus Nanoarchaeia archaeon]